MERVRGQRDGHDGTAAQRGLSPRGTRAWQAFTQSGTEGYTFQPDDAEWSTLQQYETQLAALVSRINAYCGSSIPNVAPAAPATNVARLTYVALAVVALGFVAVIGAELAPELGLVTRKLGG